MPAQGCDTSMMTPTLTLTCDLPSSLSFLWECTIAHAAAGPWHVDGEALAGARTHLRRRACARVEVAPA